MEVFDIELEDYDLKIANGDFVINESTLQHQDLLLISQKGEWKEFADVGVGLLDYINDDYNPDDLTQAIQGEFEKDGMRISKLDVNDLSNSQIIAAYK